MDHQKAVEWIGVIHKDVEDLGISNQIFRQLHQVVRNNQKFQTSPWIFLDWIAAIYGHSVVLGVRRQNDTDSSSVSLRRLLSRLRDQPNVGVCQFNPEEVEQDLALLQRHVAGIQHYADRKVAHHDQRGLGGPHPTWEDVNNCLDLLSKLVNKYSAVLTGSRLSVLPATVGTTWQQIFTYRWLHFAQDDAAPHEAWPNEGMHPAAQKPGGG